MEEIRPEIQAESAVWKRFRKLHRVPADDERLKSCGGTQRHPPSPKKVASQRLKP